MSAAEVLTFDCYGTLIDWERGISDAFLAASREDGVALHRDTVLTTYADVEPTLQRATYRSYREVLTESALECGRRLGWPVSRDRAGFLAESLPNWPPFPDTNPALEILRAQGHMLGILSNIDDDLLEGTRRHFGVAFELLVTAQQLRSYKPDHAHFERAQAAIGSRRWLHVAQSYFHDIEPACALGIPVVWVNRKRESPMGSARPTAEVTDLTQLVDWLAAPLSMQ
jgi:2-haloacid dehalogenase/putative hydrolase of the HAD superfamily